MAEPEDIKKELAYQRPDYMPQRMHTMKRFAPRPKLQSGKQTFRRLLKLYTQWRFSIILALTATLLSSAAAVYIPLLLGRAIDAFDLNSAYADKRVLLHTVILLGVCYAAQCAFTMLSRNTLERVSQNLVCRIRQEFFEKLGRLRLSFFDTHSDGDLMSRMTNDSDSISNIIAETTTHLLSSLFTVVGSLIVMFRLNLILSGVTLVMAPIVYFLTKAVTKRSRKHFSEKANALGRLNALTHETVANLKIVKVFGQSEKMKDSFNKENEELGKAAIKAQVWSGMLFPLINSLNNLSFSVIALVGGIMAIGGYVGAGMVVTFLQYSRQFGRPLNSIAGSFSNIQQALAGAERIFDIIDMPEEPLDRQDAVDITDIEGRVCFDKVDFSYVPDQSILEQLSFEAEPGKTIALVGETGAGKTTIIQLLLRFYEPQGGTILIDGVELDMFRRAGLQKNFAVVLQDTVLFSGTVLDNIRFGNPGATESEVIEAARQVQAHDFILRLPKGYNTVISGTSDSFSEGQKQLIGIARAMLCRAPILLLDEATSSVDTRTEQKIQIALSKLVQGRTCFVVAHRLSTIRFADKIMVIGNKAIIEQGSHEELLRLNSRYREMIQANCS